MRVFLACQLGSRLLVSGGNAGGATSAVYNYFDPISGSSGDRSAMRRLLVLTIILAVAMTAGAASKASSKHKHAQTALNPNAVPAEALAAMRTIDAERIRANVKFLADDLLEGRGTGQRGGDVAAAYLATQFALDGLKPAGDKGSYLQQVPLVGIDTQPPTSFAIVP